MRWPGSEIVPVRFGFHAHGRTAQQLRTQLLTHSNKCNNRMGEPSLKNGGKSSGSEDLYFQPRVFLCTQRYRIIFFLSRT